MFRGRQPIAGQTPDAGFYFDLDDVTHIGHADCVWVSCDGRTINIYARDRYDDADASLTREQALAVADALIAAAKLCTVDGGVLISQRRASGTSQVFPPG